MLAHPEGPAQVAPLPGPGTARPFPAFTWRRRRPGRQSPFHAGAPPMASVARHLSPLDRVLVEARRALETTLGDPSASRPCPARAEDPVLPRAERRHAAGLMRINRVGEVCAQGLYFGQAAVARDPATR